MWCKWKVTATLKKTEIQNIRSIQKKIYMKVETVEAQSIINRILYIPQFLNPSKFVFEGLGGSDFHNFTNLQPTHKAFCFITGR